MLDLMKLLLALGLPWAVVTVLLCLLDSREYSMPTGLAAVAGFFLSMPASAFLGWAWLRSGLSVGYLLLTVAVVLVALLAVWRFRQASLRGLISSYGNLQAPGPAGCVLLALAGINLVYAGWWNLNLGFVAWDAWDSWMLAAKTWFYSGEMNRMLPFAEWAHTADETAYALHHEQTHLATLSLATVWHAAVIGDWNEQVLTLPWWIAWCVLSAGLYSFLLDRRSGPTLSSAGVFMIASLPLASYHAMGAGYADMWVAGLAFTSAAYMIRMGRRPSCGQWAIAVALCGSLALVKISALLWVAVLGVTWFSLWAIGGQANVDRRKIYFSGTAIIGSSVVFITLVAESAAAEKVNYLSVFLEQAFSGWNWLLLWWSLPVAFALSLFLPGRNDRDFLLVASFGSLIMLTTIFSNEFIVRSHELVATANRLLLHLAPVAVAGNILMFRDLLKPNRPGRLSGS